MKIKKVIAAAVAAVMTLSGGAIALTGCGGCDHVYRQKVITAPTCMQEGLAEYTCGICNDKYTEVLPIDPDAHEYGEWNITTMPDSENKGAAEKTCTLNSQHKANTELPVLPADGEKGEYTDVRVTKSPTALSEGVLTYTFAHEAGDVAVDVAIPARGVETVADGVEAALESKSKVRICEGEWGSEIKGTQWNEEKPYAPNLFSYEFGENYTHIVDNANNAERWLSVGADGELWAFKRENGGELQKELDEEFISGQKFQFYSADLGSQYGAEKQLAYLYQRALLTLEPDRNGVSPSADFFSETYSKVGYNFTYAYETANSTTAMPKFAMVSVDFKLSEEYTLQSLTVTATVLLNNGDPEKPFTNWEKDESGKIKILNENGDRGIDYLILTQKTKTEVPAEPRNPYAQEEVFFSNYNIYKSSSDDQPVGEEEVVVVAADTSKSFYIKDVAPSTANTTFDPIEVYLVRSGLDDARLDYDTLSTRGVSATVSRSNISVRCRLAGDVTLKVKTKNVTRYLHLDVRPKAPSRLYPAVYSYSDNGYVWEEHVADTVKTVTLYVGQSLCFKAQPAQDELNYVETGYSAALFSGTAANVTIDTALVQGETVSRFTASAAGKYRIRCQTTYTGSMIGCVIDVEVVELPQMSTYLAGEFSARMQYPKPGNVKVNIEVTGANAAVATIVNMNGDTETLNVTFSQTATAPMVESVHASGANLGYSLTLNEACKLVLSRSTGFGNNVESVVLNNLEQL